MIIREQGTSSAAGMDVFATLFVIFVVIASTVLMLVGVPSLAPQDRYLIVGYYLEDAPGVSVNPDEFDVSLMLLWPGGNNPRAIWNDNKGKDGVKPTFKFRTSDPVGFFAVFNNVDDGDYRLELSYDNQAHWDNVFGSATAPRICLYAKYPLMKNSLIPDCNIGTVPQSTPPFEFVVSMKP